MRNGDLTNYFSQLVGYKIIRFEYEQDEYDDEPFPVFLLQHTDTKETLKVSVSRDPEGNGAGFLFIE